MLDHGDDVAGDVAGGESDGQVAVWAGRPSVASGSGAGADVDADVGAVAGDEGEDESGGGREGEDEDESECGHAGGVEAVAGYGGAAGLAGVGIVVDDAGRGRLVWVGR